LVLTQTLIFASVKGSDTHAEDVRRPNIVFILADNLGWGELRVYGGGPLGGAATSRIDAFAAEELLNSGY
jgi:arylsulfatase